MNMIIVNWQKYVQDTLLQDETLESVLHRLSQIAISLMHRYFKPSEYGLSDDISYEFFKFTLSDFPRLKEKYSERWRKHLYGYYGEIATHCFRGEDWHEVFAANNVNAPHLPDGYISVAHEHSSASRRSYNVKTRIKNKWGLETPKLQEDFYILVHYHARDVYQCRLIGYVSREELAAHKRNRYGRYHMPVRELHPIEYFTPDKLFDGLFVRCGELWNNVTKTLP
jgi:hypothetical protein